MKNEEINGLLVVWMCATLLGCGGSPTPPTPPPPSQQAPAVTSIAPASGSTLGGVAVTISGANFSAGATVTIGGVAAANVSVTGATTITATTPQHAAGAGDVVVTVGALSGTLPGGFTFTTPSMVSNAAPVISRITAQDRRSGAPPNFADLEDTVDVQASVTDAETPIGELTFEWTAETGAFDGSGAAVRWRAPDRFQTPATVRLTLTVIERYTGVDDRGLPAPAEHRVTSNVSIALHDSEKEIVDLGYEFLVDFSLQRPPDFVIRNFTDSCRGKSEERMDVVNNQAARTIIDYSVSNSPQVRVGFGEVCPYFASRGRVGDGCAWFPVRWRNIEKVDGRTTNTNGFDQVNAVFESGRWRLCDSDFSGTTTANGQPTAIRFKK
jgi:hypothetical protein